MIECKPYGATMQGPYTCIQKQKELVEVLKQMKVTKKRKPSSGTVSIRTETPPVRYFALQKCHGCEVGLEIYKKYLKGELSMEVETKTCPCGAIMTRWEGQNGVSWSRAKYCQECSKLTQYQREKLFKSKKTEGTPGTLEPTEPEKPIMPEKIEVKPKKEIEMKLCTGENGCGKEFPATLEYFQAGKQGPGSLDYLCKLCRNKMRRGYRAQIKNCLAVEISTFPGLMEKLQAEADKNLRTPENQALWILREALVVL
jgi:hypothetical protein